MGTGTGKESALEKDIGFTAKEMYNLKQAYYFLCLHTTTLTSCQLDENQFFSLFGSKKQYRGLWRTLFSAIDTKRDGVIDFEEFLVFIRHLKRGDVHDRRLLCFRLFNPDEDANVGRPEFRRLVEIRLANHGEGRPWSNARLSVNVEADAEEECLQFFSLVDEDQDGKFSFDDFDKYCSTYGEAVVSQVLKLFENMFDITIEETGISITSTDVKNARPHIDWQDQKIRMGGFFFCCSSAPPVFTKAPPAIKI